MYYTESPVFATLQALQIHPSRHPKKHGSPSRAEEITGSPHADPMARSWSETLKFLGISGPEPWEGLGYIGDYVYTTPLIWGDCFINHEIKIPIEQSGFNGKEAFFVAHLMGKKVDEFKKMSASCHGLWRPVFLKESSSLPSSKIYCKWIQNMKCLGGPTPFPKNNTVH